jgi:hypothetical protein
LATPRGLVGGIGGGATIAEDETKLHDHASALVRRDGVEAIVLAGTDLNLVFYEANTRLSGH